MGIPEYNMNDIRMAEREGEFYYLEFHEFISQLLDRDLYENDTERGILAYIKDNGTDRLSAKQGYRLNKILERYNNEECNICGEKIPLNEVLDLDDNDGLCSYHKHQMDKDD